MEEKHFGQISGKKTTALWAPNGGLRSVERVPRFLLFSDPTNHHADLSVASSPVPAKRDKELEKYKRALGIAVDALNMYANPESYHAIAFMGDSPCGEFADDFSRTTWGDYNRPMPGKKARQALRTLEKRYGSLVFIEPPAT